MADDQGFPDSEPNRTASGSDAVEPDDPRISNTGEEISHEPEDSAFDGTAGAEDSSENGAEDDEEQGDEDEETLFLEEVENEEKQGEERSEEDQRVKTADGQNYPDRDMGLDDEGRAGGARIEAARDVYYSQGRLTKANRDAYQAENMFFGSEEKPSFQVVSEETLARSKRVFVRPPGYERALESHKSGETSHALFIHGPDHSGKWTCALNVAQDLSPSPLLPNIVEYSRPLNSEMSLVSAISSADLPPGTVVLLADCFERNVRRQDLEPQGAQTLADALSSKKIDLILTGELDQVQLAALGVVALSAQVAKEDLQAVFEKHLDYVADQGKLVLSGDKIKAIRDRWGKLRTFLSTPFYIHQFCSKLSEVDWESLGEGRLERALKQRARDVALGGTHSAREWFDGLEPNERLLAMLVYLFEGAERRWLEALSRDLVQKYRAGGFVWFSDPREHGLEDARERIHAIDRGGRLELEDRSYEREIRRQVGNRQHLLWETLEFVLPLEPRDQWRDGRQRQALGVALGRLGLQDRGRLQAMLGEMATDSDWSRAVVPGYALQEVVRQEPDAAAEVVFKQLRSWIRSRDHKKMWAAGAASWRVYLAGQNVEDADRARAVKTGALDLLRLLATNLASFHLPDVERVSDERRPGSKSGRSRSASTMRKKAFGANLWCVVEALRQITLTDSESAVEVLAEWMKSGSASLVGVGRRATRAVYETFAKGNTPSETQRVPLLRLIPPLLEMASDRSQDVQAVFLILRSWLRSPDFPARVRGELMYLATFSETKVRDRLRAVLTGLWLDPRPAASEVIARKVVGAKRGAHDRTEGQNEREAAELARLWCVGTEDDACQIAREVVIRCYALDGALPVLSGMGQGVAIIDPAILLPTDDDSSELGASAVWRLLALLESRMDLTVLRLGETERVNVLDDSLAATELLPRFPTQRLVMPGIEAFRRSSEAASSSQRIHVMALRKPHDLDDLAAQPWTKGLYYLGPADGTLGLRADQSKRTVHLDLAWPPSPDDLERIVTTLENGWARDLASATPEEWSGLAQSFGVSGLDPASSMTMLELSARELDSPRKAARSQEDPLWRSLAFALWWAAIDLEACLTWIAAWLLPPKDSLDGRPRQVVAQAVAAALIRLYTAYPPDGSSTGRAPTLLFDLLALPLGRSGPDGVDTVLRLVEHWLEDAAWAEYLAGDVRDGAGRLERWSAEFLYDRPELSARLRARLAEARPVGDISQSWAALAAIVDRLDALRALEHPQCLPELESGQLRALLVLDGGTGGEGLRRRRAAVAAQLYQTLAGDGWGLVPAIYRLGERRPFWAGTAEAPSPERLAPSGMHPSGLIGPLLQTLDAQREQIAIILLLTDAVPVDLEDWRDSAWWIKVVLHGGAGSSISSFSTLPRPLNLSSRTSSQDPARTEVVQVATYLRERFGPSPPAANAENSRDEASMPL